MLRILKYFIVVCVLSVALAVQAFAADTATEAPKISFGGGMYGGYYNFVTVGGGTVDWEGGHGYGVGMAAEYKCNDVFSVQSGLWYGVSYINLTMERSGTIEARTESWVMPFYGIVSYSAEHFSIGILAGISFMHIRKSEFHGGMGPVSTIEVTEYLNYDMYGAAGGLQCKFGATRFVDVFVQAIAELYANKFIIDTGGRTAEYMYDIRVVAGVLLRAY